MSGLFNLYSLDSHGLLYALKSPEGTLYLLISVPEPSSRFEHSRQFLAFLVDCLCFLKTVAAPR